VLIGADHGTNLRAGAWNSVRPPAGCSVPRQLVAARSVAFVSGRSRSSQFDTLVD
jgi:hypothetical protein